VADAEPALVTLHLWRVPTRRVAAAVARVAVDRFAVGRAPGAAFVRLLGTGSGHTFRLRDAEPRRWGLLVAWARAADAAAFERTAVPRRWAALAEETWRVELRPLGSRGRWARQAPFGPDRPARWALPVAGPGGDLVAGPRGGPGAGPLAGPGVAPGTELGTELGGEPADLLAGPGGGPVAALTRARVVWRRARSFWRAVPAVAADLAGRPGLLLALGIGERPIGLQGTFSLWRSAAALRSFAYEGAAHAQAIRQTALRQWYAEELFARFAVLDAVGTVDGRDPLRAAAPW
jgi:hypothetical protein